MTKTSIIPAETSPDNQPLFCAVTTPKTAMTATGDAKASQSRKWIFLMAAFISSNTAMSAIGAYFTRPND